MTPQQKLCLSIFLLLNSTSSYASFIESTSGLAVVNDATATYYNPAALTLLQTKQIVGLESYATFHSKFTGSFTQVPLGFTLNGTASNNVNYNLPSLYFGLPINKNIFAGVAIVSNSFNNNTDETSLLRYVQSSNDTRNIDIAPAIGIKLNDYLSIGGNINFSTARFIMEPLIGFPSLNIPDSQSRNDSTSNSIGGDFGFLVTPSKSTQIGFNYRSAISYNFTGKSVLNGTRHLVSNQYKFTFWTPARLVVSVRQRITDKFGLIGTVQYIQWNIFKTMHIEGIATQVGPQALIINSTVPYHLHNGWVFTLGNQYQINSKWIVRAAGTYLQSPQNGNYQLAIGDSFVLGASLSYAITKNINIDGSYAHGFMKNKNINIRNPRNIISGTNVGSRDSLSLKLTVNV